ncbi:pyruvate carboxylase [Longilinea arvoryzae]|uniref:Pyruvate carboxylase n=1 Tax=Longilinea arvoryzae TaxID=360412 RepID=A0A0S7BJK5_9CHLR|nr:acetyl-CoA carboxylase biotin carboxyl carrier protein subunit [Longilinea arvoryzae]GAP14787.1 pyruvate carboxylase [Longilinea arvoryzae]
MTTYLVRVSEREYQVDVAGEQIRVNGRPFKARLTPINQNGHFMLQTDSAQREVHIRASGQDAFLATMASRYFSIQVERNQRNPRKAVPANQGDIKAPMPAKVIRVCVQPGEQVKAGQTVLLLESMKMQMDIKAPFSGVVEAVFVQDNTQVEKGHRMMSILPVLIVK